MEEHIKKLQQAYEAAVRAFTEAEWNSIESKRAAERCIYYRARLRLLDVEDPEAEHTEEQLAHERAPHANLTEAILEKLKNDTPEEARKSFIEAGIVDENGNLTEPYR